MNKKLRIAVKPDYNEDENVESKYITLRGHDVDRFLARRRIEMMKRNNKDNEDKKDKRDEQNMQ